MIESQLTEIRNYLLSKKLPIDILIEVNDHFISQISDLQREENLSFEVAFEKTKESWKDEFKTTVPFYVLTNKSNAEITNFEKKIKKNFKTTRGIDNLLNQSYDSDNHFIACINYAMDHEYIGVKPEYVKGAGNNGNNKYTRNGSKTNIKPDYGSGFDEFN